MRVIHIERAYAPIRRIVIAINLEPWEDRKAEQGGTDKGVIELKEASEEPECFELRCDGGRQILNKGQLEALGKALLELAGYDLLLHPDETGAEKVVQLLRAQR